MRVHVYCDIEEYAAALRISSEQAEEQIGQGRFASILLGDIRIYGPRFERRPSVERRRIIYHEYFHAVQHSLSRNHSSRGERLLWLIEEVYRLGAVASDYLVTKYGLDLVRHDFWAALAGTDWRSAFLHVFGVGLDEFYAEFESYRTTLRP